MVACLKPEPDRKHQGRSRGRDEPGLDVGEIDEPKSDESSVAQRLTGKEAHAATRGEAEISRALGSIRGHLPDAERGALDLADNEGRGTVRRLDQIRNVQIAPQAVVDSDRCR